MRRRAGVGAIQKKKLVEAKYKDKGNEIQENQLAEMSKQLETFRDRLEEFATEHKNDIKKDPAFRKHFQDMCASIGVDPLASGKGFWSEMLGVGDFYYELGVQIVEVCMATSHRTGGLMELGELRRRLIRSRGKRAAAQQQEISNDDMIRAIKKLKILGNGFTLIPLQSGRYLVQSIPGNCKNSYKKNLCLLKLSIFR
jgi:ESCRT-II complex subunit VPS22